MRKTFSLFFMVLFGLLCLSGCGNSDEKWEKGYENAWDGFESSSFWTSKEEQEGYEEGLSNSSSYDEGYDDAIDRKKPKYRNDLFYMDGYRDGKKQR